MPSIGNMFAVTVAPVSRSGSSVSESVRLRPLTRRCQFDAGSLGACVGRMVKTNSRIIQ